MNPFQGINIAAITPRGNLGDVDLGATFELLDHLSSAGVSGIVLFGPAGEYPAFTTEERARVAYLAVKRSRVPLLVGVGSATLEDSLALAREARDAGAAGLLLPPPFFYPYEHDDIREFYLQFAAQLGDDGVTWISNTPEFTSAIDPETAIELLQTGHFAGIEDASGDLDNFARLKAAGAGNWCGLLSGDDAVFTKTRCGAGAVSAAGCAVPELVVALDRAAVAGDQERIERLGRIFNDFVAWTRRFPHPNAIQAATALRGLKTGLPAMPLPAEKQRLMDQFREWFRATVPELHKLKKLSAHG